MRRSLERMVRHRMTLEQYLKSNCERQVIDHAIRAEIGKDGNPRFYIHPANVSGDTLDVVVTKNQLHPVYVWDGLQQLAADNPIPPDIRAKMDADRAKAEMSNDQAQAQPPTATPERNQTNQ